MSLKGACDKLESAFAVAESKLDRVNEKVDQSIAQANNSGQAAGKFFSSSNTMYFHYQIFQMENHPIFFKI